MMTPFKLTTQNEILSLKITINFKYLQKYHNNHFELCRLYMNSQPLSKHFFFTGN